MAHLRLMKALRQCQEHEAKPAGEHEPFDGAKTKRKPNKLSFLNLTVCHLLPADLWEGLQWAQFFPPGLRGPRGYEEKLYGKKVHTSWSPTQGQIFQSPNEEREHSQKHRHGTQNSAIPQSTGVCWLQLWWRERIISVLGVAQEEETKKSHRDRSNTNRFAPVPPVSCCPCPSVLINNKSWVDATCSSRSTQDFGHIHHPSQRQVERSTPPKAAAVLHYHCFPTFLAKRHYFPMPVFS